MKLPSQHEREFELAYEADAVGVWSFPSRDSCVIAPAGSVRPAPGSGILLRVNSKSQGS
jgi:hypothetical protein